MAGVRIAFQGAAGAYSEEAALHFWSRRGIQRPAEPVPCADFEEVVARVERGDAELGILPVENSLEGNIDEATDLIAELDLQVVGEEELRVSHCLLAKKGTAIDAVRTVHSHPQGLRQCKKWLREKGFERVPVYDTAGAARAVAESDRSDVAAIASRRAAEIYGLEVLRAEVESDLENYTRFFVVARDRAGRIVRRGDGPWKTSIVFSTRHEPGALHRALGVLAAEGINLTKLESRPRRGQRWKYVFLADLEGGIEDPRVERAIAHLASSASFLKVIGSYESTEAS